MDKSFTGLNTPVYIEDALDYFVKNAIIEVYDGNIVINLVDYFPLLKQRYTLRGTLTSFFHLYSTINNLNNLDNLSITPDGLMKEAFDGTIPAYYSLYRDDMGRPKRILMQEAVDLGLIQNYLSTFQVLEKMYSLENQGGFTSDNFNSYFLQNLISLNIIRCSDIKECAAILEDPTLLEELLNESDLMSQLNKIISTFKFSSTSFSERRKLRRDARNQGSVLQGESPKLGPVKVIDIFKIANDDISKYNLVVETLANDERLNQLNISILLQDIPRIIEYLPLYDPRDNKHESYFLAVETGNQEIIDLIKDTIIQRNLLETAAYGTVVKDLGYANKSLPKNLLSYSRRNF